ncbi:hypothetical protein KC960_03195 [Candidatus Saccharibacteria bacterium]|nr:hypothetical protein [Candidatus Saccharibacteria bacterium]
MKDLQKYLDKLKKFADSSIEFVANYRVLILFMILGLAVGFALYRTGTFINISRDEQRYTEETARIKYSKIDEKIIESFSDKKTDKNVEVNSQYDPTRSNPFVN